MQGVINNGIYGYTRWRHSDLLTSITSWYDKRFNTAINSTDIIYSPSVLYSISTLVKLKSNVGDKVMFFTPAYDAFFNTISYNERVIVEEKLELVDNEFVINFKSFEENIKDCAILLFCSPHNPVGKVWSLEELEKISEICKRNNVFIISDEIHMDVVFKKKHIPFIKVDNEVAIVTSPTKTFIFPGFIFSYAIISDKSLKERFEFQLKQADGLSSCSIPGLHATMYAYNHLGDYVDEMNDYI